MRLLAQVAALAAEFDDTLRCQKSPSGMRLRLSAKRALYANKSERRGTLASAVQSLPVFDCLARKSRCEMIVRRKS
jgi:hypothetical protein